MNVQEWSFQQLSILYNADKPAFFNDKKPVIITGRCCEVERKIKACCNCFKTRRDGWRLAYGVFFTAGECHHEDSCCEDCCKSSCNHTTLIPVFNKTFKVYLKIQIQIPPSPPFFKGGLGGVFFSG